MAINLRTLHPIQMVGRAQCHQAIREIGAEKIFKSKKENHVFLLEYDDGTHEIDWEFCLFEATDYQLEKLLEGFLSIPKEAGARIIGPNGAIIEFPAESETSKVITMNPEDSSSTDIIL